MKLFFFAQGNQCAAPLDIVGEFAVTKTCVDVWLSEAITVP